jgi:hypothetical protein
VGLGCGAGGWRCVGARCAALGSGTVSVGCVAMGYVTVSRLTFVKSFLPKMNFERTWIPTTKFRLRPEGHIRCHYGTRMKGIQGMTESEAYGMGRPKG